MIKIKLRNTDSESNSYKAIRATVFVLFGFGLSQIIRLASNLVLARLLVPEIFGVMALCNVVILGINLFSDIGTAQGIIRSNKSEDPEFINTAYTLQVIRGGVLFFVFLIAAYPVSLIYEQKQIFYLLPVLGLNTIIQGFNSTSLVILSKDLKQGKLNVIELITQIISALISVVIAYIYPTIWSLVFGVLFSSLVKMIWSHILKQNIRNRFCINKMAMNELLSFGKWIFISTMMTFFATQTDRLIIGKLFELSFFGVYNIALMLSDLPKQIISKLSRQVFYPLLSRYIQYPREELRSKILRHRRFILYPLSIGIALFACFGDFLILFLYDDRYASASWIFPILVIGIWPLVLYSTADTTLLAIGKPKYLAFANLTKFLYMVIFIPFFFKLWGIFGAILAVVLNDIPVYIAITIGLLREKISFSKQDLLATLCFCFFIGCLLLLRFKFDLGYPGEMAFTSMHSN